MAVRLTVTHKETDTQVYEYESSVYYKTSRICFTDVSYYYYYFIYSYFHLDLIKMKCFDKIGTYTLVFESNFSGVSPVTHTMYPK